MDYRRSCKFWLPITVYIIPFEKNQWSCGLVTLGRNRKRRHMADIGHVAGVCVCAEGITGVGHGSHRTTNAIAKSSSQPDFVRAKQSQTFLFSPCQQRLCWNKEQ